LYKTINTAAAAVDDAFVHISVDGGWIFSSKKWEGRKQYARALDRVAQPCLNTLID
jgi:hypothetical protein